MTSDKYKVLPAPAPLNTPQLDTHAIITDLHTDTSADTHLEPLFRAASLIPMLPWSMTAIKDQDC